MRRSLALTFILITFGHAFAQADDGFQSLFDGKTLEAVSYTHLTLPTRAQV